MTGAFSPAPTCITPLTPAYVADLLERAALAALRCELCNEIMDAPFAMPGGSWFLCDLCFDAVSELTDDAA